jgi:hypothetical protein
MATRGEYHRLFRLQASGYTRAGDAPGGPDRTGGPQEPALCRTPDGRGGAPAQTAAGE